MGPKNSKIAIVKMLLVLSLETAVARGIQCSHFFERAKFYKKTGEKRALFQQKNGQKTGEIKKCHGKKRALSGFFIPIVVTLPRLF